MKNFIIHNLKLALWGGVVFCLIVLGCEKGSGIDSQTIVDAEGYVIGHHPCVGSTTVTTSRGEGKGYLIATFSPSVDTIMVFGFAAELFDIPESRYTMTGFFPVQNQEDFKVRFSYEKSQENIGKQFACPAYFQLNHLLRYVDREYIAIRAERIE